MEHGDFVEGVRARLVEKKKGRPDWNPARLEDVTEDMVAGFFAGCDSNQQRLRLISSGSGTKYSTYPHAWLGLPTEKDIMQRFQNEKAVKATLRKMMLEQDERVGVREKVMEVLQRHGLI